MGARSGRQVDGARRPALAPAAGGTDDRGDDRLEMDLDNLALARAREQRKDRIERLAEVWSAAVTTSGADVSQEVRGEAADPRLAAHMHNEAAVRVRMRTSVLTLVVIAPRWETSERALAAINALHRRHRARWLVTPSDIDGPATMDAHIYAECKLNNRSGAEMCTEEILIKAGGELAQHLSRVVTPLLIHDLPVVLWWPDDPPFGTKQFNEVIGTADRLLVDSGGFQEDGAKRLAGMATGDLERGFGIGWLRRNLWREFSPACSTIRCSSLELDHIRAVRIDVARPTSTLRISKAAFYLGWLASRLGRGRATAGRRRCRGGLLPWRVPPRMREITVELRPGPDDARWRATRGRLARPRRHRGHPAAATVRARITRQADHLLATADWNGAQVSRRAGQLEPFDETPFIAEALDSPGLDKYFEQALVRAVRLVSSG